MSWVGECVHWSRRHDYWGRRCCGCCWGGNGRGRSGVRGWEGDVGDVVVLLRQQRNRRSNHDTTTPTFDLYVQDSVSRLIPLDLGSSVPPTTSSIPPHPSLPGTAAAPWRSGLQGSCP